MNTEILAGLILILLNTMGILPRDNEAYVEQAGSGQVDREYLLSQAEKGITDYLTQQKEKGFIAENYFKIAIDGVLPNLRSWYLDDSLDNVDHSLRDGVTDAIRSSKWEELVNTYIRRASFSATGGLRALMASDKESILSLQRDGLEANYLKGPATINDVVVALTSLGAAQYGLAKGFKKLIVGCDSRVRGEDFAWLVARVFLAHGYTVYIFDEPCMYPNICFSVPTLKADVGIFISASHNDYRYNGFKITAPHGASLEMSVRDEMFDKYISKTKPSDIKLADLKTVSKEKLWFLGGEKTGKIFESGENAGFPIGKPRPGYDYLGREDQILDIHTPHVAQVKKFMQNTELLQNQKDSPRKLSVAYSANHGSGRRIVPWILREVGVADLKVINRFSDLNGMFPSFCSDPGKEQQPDPGDERAAEVTVKAFKEEYHDAWKDLDIIIANDPDADRSGLVVKVPEHLQKYYDGKDYTLLPADDAWLLVIWYLLEQEKKKYGKIRDVETKYVSLTHTTNEMIARVARKYGLGVVYTWVGFVMLGSATRYVWDNKMVPAIEEGRTDKNSPKCHPFFYKSDGMDTGKRVFNFAAAEQSAGMSIFGGLPKSERDLGEGGHVRDKDGTFAALLLTELAAYVKDKGSNLLDVMNQMYLDPEIGMFVNYYEPDPMDGAYPGLKGDTHKREVLMAAIKMHEDIQAGKEVVLGGLKVKSSIAFWTGKYDKANWEGFPDEGLRFYFDDEKLSSFILRPSGTANAIRLHVLLQEKGEITKENVNEKRVALLKKAKEVVDDVRAKIGAARDWA